jgi:hypothetical protein
MIFRFTINFGYWRHIYLDLISQFKVINLRHSKLLLKILPGDQEGLFKLAIQLRHFFNSVIYNTATGYVLLVYLTNI